MLDTNFESKDSVDKLWSAITSVIDPLYYSGLSNIKIEKTEKRKDQILLIGTTRRAGERLKFSILISKNSTQSYLSIRRWLGDYFLFNMWMRKFIEALNKFVSIKKL